MKIKVQRPQAFTISDCIVDAIAGHVRENSYPDCYYQCCDIIAGGLIIPVCITTDRNMSIICSQLHESHPEKWRETKSAVYRTSGKSMEILVDNNYYWVTL